jgi:hypothetical protein
MNNQLLKIKKMKLFKDLVTKYGLGFIIGAATLDGYRRQVINDCEAANNILEKIKTERESNTAAIKVVAFGYDKILEEKINSSKSKATVGKYQEAADEHKKAVDNYNTNPSEYNQNEQNKSLGLTKLKRVAFGYDELTKLDISDYFISLYDKYSEFLDSLSADKIVCLFNIIIEGLILSSFISVLSIMLSENIINQIVFLEKYPSLWLILKLLRLRNVINKKVLKFYLLMHFILIISGILGNIYMFFI